MTNPNMEQKRDDQARIANSKDGTSKIDFKLGWDACKAECESEFEVILRLLHDEAYETAKEVCEENMSYSIK